MHEPLPFFSIVVPTLNEESHIETVLTQLLPAPEIDCELIVVDGGSTDRTLAIVNAFSGRDGRVRILDNPARHQAPGVNLAIKNADSRARYFVRADAHCDYPDAFCVSVVTSLVTTGATSVVVPMRTVGSETEFQRCAALAQNSVLGNGGASHRNESGKVNRFVDHGHHAGFDLEFFLVNGGYDESFTVNEDGEYDLRTAKAGAKVWMNFDCEIDYFPRKSLASLTRQYFRYGTGRARTLIKNKAFPKVRQMIPVAVTLGVCFGLVGSLRSDWWLILPLGYFGPLAALSYRKASGEKPANIANVFLALASMHLSWGAGFLFECAKASSHHIRGALK